MSLKLNKSKVKLRKTEVKLMGHLISNEGLKPDPDKVTAIKNMPKLTSNSEVQTLLCKLLRPPFSVAGQHREIKHLLTSENIGTIVMNCPYTMAFSSKALE